MAGFENYAFFEHIFNKKFLFSLSNKFRRSPFSELLLKNQVDIFSLTKANFEVIFKNFILEQLKSMFVADFINKKKDASFLCGFSKVYKLSYLKTCNLCLLTPMEKPLYDFSPGFFSGPLVRFFNKAFFYKNSSKDFKGKVVQLLDKMPSLFFDSKANYLGVLDNSFNVGNLQVSKQKKGLEKLFTKVAFALLNYNYYMSSVPKASEIGLLNNPKYFFGRSYSIFKNFSNIIAKHFIFFNPFFANKSNFEEILSFFSFFSYYNFFFFKDSSRNFFVQTDGFCDLFELLSTVKLDFSFGKALDFLATDVDFYNCVFPLGLDNVRNCCNSGFFFGLFKNFNISYKDYLTSFFFSSAKTLR